MLHIGRLFQSLKRAYPDLENTFHRRRANTSNVLSSWKYDRMKMKNETFGKWLLENQLLNGLSSSQVFSKNKIIQQSRIQVIRTNDSRLTCNHSVLMVFMQPKFIVCCFNFSTRAHFSCVFSLCSTSQSILSWFIQCGKHNAIILHINFKYEGKQSQLSRAQATWKV